jgi:hypothetical protein
MLTESDFIGISTEDYNSYQLLDLFTFSKTISTFYKLAIILTYFSIF